MVLWALWHTSKEREQRKNRCSLSLLVCRKARNTASEAYIRLCGVQTLTTLVEQARVELASYRIAERLSTRLCRNYLRGALSAAEKSARQKPENRRCVGSGPPRLYPAFFDARIPPTGKGERTNRLTVN